MATELLEHPHSGSGTGVAGDDPRMRKDFGLIGLLFAAIGSIIGSGWLFSSLHASSQAGPAALISWIVGTVMFGLIGLSYAELGVMFPHSGGVARYPHYSFGSFASYSFGWVTWLAAAAVASVEVIAVMTYANSYLPWLLKSSGAITWWGFLVSVGLMAVFVCINFFGVRWFARINNVLVWWKLAMICVVIAAFLILGFHGSHFSAYGGFAPYGLKSAFEAIPGAGIAFSFLGFRQGIEMAGETNNPRRNVPLTVVGSVVICGILYFLLQLAFIGAVDGHDVAKQGWKGLANPNVFNLGNVAGTFAPLATVATFLGLSWLAYLLYADAIISPSDTGLIYTGVTARMSYAMGRNRNAPKELSSINRHGVPWVSLIVSFIVGVIFFLPFPSWTALVSIVTSMTVLSFGSGPIVLLCMRRQLPNQERPYRQSAVWIIAPLALYSTNLIMYWAGWDQVWKMMAAIGIGYVFLVFFQITGLARIRNWDFRHGWWVLLWFGGITLVSWLGSYSGTSSTDAGQYNWYGFDGGLIANAILTIVILALAYVSQLPSPRVEEILTHRDDEEVAPPALA